MLITTSKFGVCTPGHWNRCAETCECSERPYF